MTQERNDMDEIERTLASRAESRFNRRRFLKSSAAAAPVLMAVQSPAAWACSTSNTSCGVINGSVNTSDPAGNIVSACRSPRFWHKALKCGNGSVLRPTRDFLNHKGCYYETSASNKCSGFFSHTIHRRGYKCTVTLPNSATLGGVCEYDSHFYIGAKISKNGSTKDFFDLCEGKKSIFNRITAGFLNGQFSPEGYIDYPYSGENVRVMFARSIEQSMERAINKYKRKRSVDGCSQPMRQLGKMLNTWTGD